MHEKTEVFECITILRFLRGFARNLEDEKIGCANLRRNVYRSNLSKGARGHARGFPAPPGEDGGAVLTETAAGIPHKKKE